MEKLNTDYNFSKIEKRWQKFWKQEKFFEFKYDKKKPLYIVDTPPPYVSADHLHAGHIMSYAQAEFIVRYKRMKGFNVFYPMGFDDNGLPTERFVEKKYKINKAKITKPEFVKLCLKETRKGAKTYKKLWDNLGISVDWSKTYSTISPIAQKVSQWSLIDLWEKGGLYQKQMPILWCSTCRTAIAQADLEDKEEKSKLNHIAFKTKTGGKDLIIATTRPELLGACVALYANKKDKRYKNLIGKKAIVPIFGYEVPIKQSDQVQVDKGTGLMMVCTWGDIDDLEKWRNDKLTTRALIEENGKLNALGKKYKGLSIMEARKAILKDLEKAGDLKKQEKITHTLNVHERCDTPMELVKSKQWFIKIASKKKIWLDFGKKINWFPKSSKKIYRDWVNSLKWDWCISRQRFFGVPFPIWHCQKCGKKIFAKKNELPVDPTVDEPPNKKCPECKSSKIKPETDVMDTWATSACTPFLLRELMGKKNKELYKKMFPPDLRPNAFEIIRTWDFYSIVKSYYNLGAIPFKNIMISGHGLDQHGRKFSKRLNNYKPSDQLLSEYGADPIRYWATGATLGQNLKFNEKEIKKGRKTAIKLLNAANLLVLNFKGVRLKNLALDHKILEPTDIWILNELNKSLKKVEKGFENYSYADSKNELDNFFWSKFADYYLEFIKHRLNSPDSSSALPARQTLYYAYLAILKMYAPILPFICEEIYQKVFRNFEKGKSIHIGQWPKKIKKLKLSKIKDFDKFLAAVDEIRKYKSENKISMSQEIDHYKLKTSLDLEKYSRLIKKILKIKNLK
ncbi:MAG: valine--tRNA ligase [Candidatus Moranbacteria bacterium]|nr:valine--tRNA ligase [Candidatus Moranbacteria bacterium]